MRSGLSVVVCSYRRPKSLASCLASLADQQLPGLTVCVVAVEDDVETRLVAESAGVELVCQRKPGGISSARNFGVAHVDTDAIAFIDDDARARPGWAAGLSRAISKPRVGAVGGPVYDTRTGQQVVHDWRVDPFGVTHVERNGREGNQFPVLNGCNMAFSVAALSAVRGFDPYYRYYFDETDVCVRIRRQGFDIRFIEDAIVDHDFADGPTRERFLYFSTKMRAYFSLKNFRREVSIPRLLLGQVLLLRQDLRVYRSIRNRYAGISGDWRAVTETVMGRLQGSIDGLFRPGRDASIDAAELGARV